VYYLNEGRGPSIYPILGWIYYIYLRFFSTNDSKALGFITGHLLDDWVYFHIDSIEKNHLNAVKNKIKYNN